MKNKITYLSLFILLISLAASGQPQVSNVSVVDPSITSDTKVNMHREIRLEQNSKPEDIILAIEEDVDRFELVINSSVTAGDLKIELYDPKGINQGTFSLGTQLNAEKPERISGNINKSLTDPQQGNWKVSIIPVDATGTVTIRSAAVY